MPFCHEKGQKEAKVGRTVWQNQLFCIYCSILAHCIFLIFCMKLETIKGYKLVLNHFLRKIPILQILAIFDDFLAEKWTLQFSIFSVFQFTSFTGLQL